MGFALLSGAFTFFVSLVALNLFVPNDALMQIYEKLQIPLFSGFLTIGGFLLSLKTFILVKLKEDLYGRESYKKRVDERRALAPNANISTYGPLSRLGSFLVYSVAASLITAILQISLGFIKYSAISALCMAAACTTLVYVGFAWWNIKCSLADWFALLEDEEVERLKK